MAPFKLVFTTVLVLVSMVLECSSSPSARCPTSCSCLGSLVDCSRRGLLDVPTDLPHWTTILDLQRNNIVSVDDSSFSGLDNLTELDLSNNQLSIINSTTFQNLSSLQKLIINHNRLVELPVLENCSHLTLLSLQHNEIHSLNVSILEGLPRLQILDLSFNHLVDLPANTFGNSSTLLHLTLSHNRLVGLEKGLFDGLSSLESLKLSKNRLPSLPKELFRHLHTLQHLELNSNAVVSVEGLSFQGLSSLLVLKMRHSNVHSLQDGAFYGLSGIKKLQLDYNNIGKVTKGWLYGLNSLQRLYINNNNISEIEDDAWDSGRRLLELDMSHNQLQFVSSKTFDKLHALKRLVLADNRITYIEEDAFRPLAALQYLELQNNAVRWSVEDPGVGVFGGLGRLRYLGLAGNGIRSVVKGALAGMGRLNSLNLTHNALTTLEEGAFAPLPQLQQLELVSRSLLCDCRLAWAARSFPLRVREAACGYPPTLRGRSIFALRPEDMTCGGVSPKPVLVRDPPTRITLKGENVTLECRASAPPEHPPTFHWRKDGRLLPPSVSSVTEVVGDVSSSVLRLPAIRDEDEGRYQCVASNQFGATYSSKARITVHVFPVFSRVPSPVSVRGGGTARLECGARGQPRPSVSWQKDGGAEDFPAARERRMHVMPTDDVFFIVNTRPSDSGLYTCTASNVAGTIRANATLTVLEPPSFVRPMEDKEVRGGETAVLECLSSGSPPPTLRWSRGALPLLPTERHFFTAHHQLLIIVQAQAADAGEYACEMTNALGTQKGTSRLRVLQVSEGGSGGVFGGGDEGGAVTTGVVVIAVVICIVGTSLIWVIIIYHTRKRTLLLEDHPSPPHPPYPTPPGIRTPFVDTHSVSGQSKDSSVVSAGRDSGRQSSDETLGEDERLLTAHHYAVCSSRRSPLLSSFRHQGSLSCEHVEEGDSGCSSTLPRSASARHWGPHSPAQARLLRPKDVPNDSGSFSMGGEEGGRCRSTPSLPT